MNSFAPILTFVSKMCYVAKDEKKSKLQPSDEVDPPEIEYPFRCSACFSSLIQKRYSFYLLLFHKVNLLISLVHKIMVVAFMIFNFPSTLSSLHSKVLLSQITFQSVSKCSYTC